MPTDLIIHVEKPPATRLNELLNNPPMSILANDYKAVRWLDEVKAEANKLQQIKKEL